MNLYLIEDNATKAAHLPGFSAQAQAYLQVSFVIPEAWANPTVASRNAAHIATALRDREGLILLDLVMDAQEYKDAAEALLAEFPQSLALFEERYEKIFDSNEMFELATTVWTIGETLGCRILICTTAHGQPEPAYWTRLGRQALFSHFAINWPSSVGAYTWPQEDFDVIRTVVEQHWRMDYDRAAQSWSVLSSEVLDLFPHGPMHPAASHVGPPVNAASGQIAKNVVDAFFGTAQIPLSSSLTTTELIYFAKGASYAKNLSLATVCRLLDVTLDAGPALALEIANPGPSPGAVLRAFAMLKQSTTRCGRQCAWAINVNNGGAFGSCRITATTEFTDQDEALKAAEKLRRSPSEQMREELPRPAPGMATLALDYLPATISARGAIVKMEMQFNITELP